MAKWFYERMSPMGRWSPQVSYTEPSSKSTSGLVNIRNKTLLPPEDEALTFDEIYAKYRPKEIAPAWATHQHVRTGKFYEVTDEGRLEVTGDDAYPLVEYRDEKGNRYAQNRARFHDGRFAEVPVVQRTGD